MKVFPGDIRFRLMFYRPEGAATFVGMIEDLKRRRGLADVMSPDAETGLLRSGFFDFDAFEFADRLTMPVLVVVGSHDSEIDIENSERFSVAVANGYFSRLRYSGHFPFIEQPKGLATRVLRFFRDEGL